METDIDEEDVVKEMYDGEYNRVDIVAGPASGMRFVVLKAGGEQDPALVDLDRKDTTSDGSTVTKAADTATPVTKADDDTLPDSDDLMADAVPGAAGSEVPTDAPGDPDEPSSPAWEAVDAARARSAVNMVIGLKRLVEVSLGRETQEAAVGADGDDFDNAYDLSDVLDCLDCILDTLAPFAVGEQAEAEDRETDAATMVTKAGRILSGTNEGLIRQAQQALSQVLASLPEATVPEGDPVTKSETAATAAPDPAALEAAAVEPVVKADDTGLLAVYSQTGKLLGAVDPAKLTPLSTGDDDQPASTDTDDPTSAADDATPPAATDAAPPAAPAPAPAPTVPDPTEPVTKAADTEDPTEVLKSVLAGVVKEALTPLEDRVAKMEAHPAVGGPLLRGATGDMGQLYLRGQNADHGNDPEIVKVTKEMEQATNPLVRAQLNRQLSMLKLAKAYGPTS